MINYIIGIGAFLVVVLVIKNFIKNIKDEKSSCGCSCKGCLSNDNCNKISN
ncbi:FeoB-associated Cys-rich membrane protein [Romboutsia ilealis]|uniref:FeoB-associated Cys-rich membrane protein n=1 Tax=Romboutsia faecis TaxID=2764597 RepID=A0ABR7JLZ6_9FIRM|nr:FeoB-associated Cys-rich membrane protein [Romboutsia faecis]MBC5995924.1 FeoB-associated Cys-rich membrane protein [Romboutsia faecis]MRN23124.1 FeoB-associated Cys-rich membrane protein [Romboutsia ilealis]